MCSPRSSAGSATRPARSRWWLPTTITNGLQPPLPLLFQRRVGTENRAINASAIRNPLDEALAATGLNDPDGRPLRFVPHDFRRIFITDAVMNGMPPHIAQLVVGHRDLNTTMGYKAVYPEEAINGHRAFIARRRELRPSAEYRTPTDEEWQEFLGHFERRKLALGDCGRASGTACIHEHSCLQMPTASHRPGSAATTGSHPREPDCTHRRSPAGGLDRRSRRTRHQPRRRRAETRPARQPHRPACHHPPRHARLSQCRRPQRHHRQQPGLGAVEPVINPAGSLRPAHGDLPSSENGSTATIGRSDKPRRPESGSPRWTTHLQTERTHRLKPELDSKFRLRRT